MWITESSIIKARNAMIENLMFPAEIPRTIDVTVAMIIAKPKILAANLINASKNGPMVIASVVTTAIGTNNTMPMGVSFASFQILAIVVVTFIFLSSLKYLKI